VPTQDAIQEFRVSTSNVSAEFGRFAGGVSIATKLRTNTLHVSAYEFVRNKVFDSNNLYIGNSSYNSTQIKVEKRFKSGWMIMGSHT
jgi:hypothetical protein